MIKPDCVGLSRRILSIPFVSNYTILLLQHTFLHRRLILRAKCDKERGASPQSQGFRKACHASGDIEMTTMMGSALEAIELTGSELWGSSIGGEGCTRRARPDCLTRALPPSQSLKAFLHRREEVIRVCRQAPSPGRRVILYQSALRRALPLGPDLSAKVLCGR